MAAPVEKSLTLDSGTGMLAGTLLTPENPKDAVLMLAGSGPTDRDGNSILGIRAASYRLLAQGLAAHGIASLRVDKRGIAQSAVAMTAEADLRIGTYADDAKAWAAELRKQTGLRCVWLLGHSGRCAGGGTCHAKYRRHLRIDFGLGRGPQDGRQPAHATEDCSSARICTGENRRASSPRWNMARLSPTFRSRWRGSSGPACNLT